MLNFLPAPILYVLNTTLVILSTIVFATLIIIGGLVKLILPGQTLNNLMSHWLTELMRGWAITNGLILKLTCKLEWKVTGDTELSRQSWYLVVSNHLSGFDIAALCYVFRHRIPMLKFFLKRSLIYVPFLGLGCWALNMPFMRRHTPAQIKKNPNLKGKDMESTRKACEHFKHLPTSIMNFVEGSRYEAKKHQRQNSPYQYLLKPKAGGIAFALATLGSQFDKMLDVTLIYPDSAPDILAAILRGEVTQVQVHIRSMPAPKIDAQRYLEEASYRAEFQQWLNKLWAEKDALIAERLRESSLEQKVYPEVKSQSA
ncbi:acyltransferase [Paraferrimonas sedimenticola]|uniref:Phospholipid/glycerol acyltransferase n=1 Tax=Paraferrimonas sedimenticola TaxID=375674 RepID=A0AA37W2A2_9GAMM|nr:acyltransferase [Paraferrimonas sedimenticola]GLP97572.1 phospholipid/glycerol acyltransferase [Paraferrimonas sedimenticola]